MADITTRHVTFASAGKPALRLEGLLSLPANASETSSETARLSVVALCHPQPAASSMDDPVIRATAEGLAAAGFAALRFNFRGTGASEGQSSDGRLEPLDCAGAAEFLLGQPFANPEKLAFVGHAFGATMALTYAAYDPRVRTVVAISPPMFRITPELGAFDRPRLFITGELDEVAPRHKLEPWLATLPGQRHLKIVSGARHLLREHEATVAQIVVNYLSRWAHMPGI